MNLKQAEAIATLYQEFLESIPRELIPVPEGSWTKWTRDDIDTMYLEDGCLTVKWSKYRGCGEYDRHESNVSLHQLFD